MHSTKVVYGVRAPAGHRFKVMVVYLRGLPECIILLYQKRRGWLRWETLDQAEFDLHTMALAESIPQWAKGVVEGEGWTSSRGRQD